MLNATKTVHRSPVAGWPGVTVQGHSKSQLQFSKYVPSTCQLTAQLPNYHRTNPCRLSSHASQSHARTDRKSTRLNSSHMSISYAVFCLKKKKKHKKLCTNKKQKKKNKTKKK